MVSLGAIRPSSSVARPRHRRSAVGVGWKGGGRPPSGAQSPETAPELPGEPPKIDLHGVDDVDEARARTPPNPPSPPTLLRYGGTAAERSHR